MNTNKLIHIVCAANDLYSIMVCALLKSIEENHHTDEMIIFHMIDNGIKRSNKKRILKSTTSGKIEVQWIKISEETYQNIHPDANQIDLSAHYARFLIPHILDQEIEKVIYIDCDTVVLGEISELWNIPLGSNVIAAAQDGTGTIEDQWLGDNFDALGLDPTEKYFNSGVLLIDTALWRARSMTATLIQCTIDNLAHVRFFDQYAFNVVFHKQWTELPSSWNHMQVKPNQEEINLVHYVAWNKPIIKTSTGPYHSFFYKYLDKATDDSWRPYIRLDAIEEITAVQEIPILLERLSLVYRTNLSKNQQGIVVEPESSIISKRLLDEDEKLHLIRLVLIKIDQGFQLDLAHEKALNEAGTFDKVNVQMQPYKHQVSVLQKSGISISNTLAQTAYSFVYLDIDEPMKDQKFYIAILINMLHFGGLMCGMCTQETRPTKEDFDIFKFYEATFQWKTKDIRIHQDAQQPNRWFWYFIREY